jgi:methionine-rich copper-binding protein CopC
MRMSARFVILCAVALANPSIAHAHAELRRASPEANSTVSESPHEVTLLFSEAIEPVFSSADVTDANGARVDQGKAAVSGSTIRVGLKTLTPGSYRVHWKAVSTDTHRAEGSFMFNVRGP